MPARIDALLIHWARWSVYRSDVGLGFARSTTLGRVIELGPAGAAIRQAPVGRTIAGNETAEQIDRLVAQLPDHLKTVVRLEYLGRDSRKQNAKHLCLSYEAFRSRLRAAKAHLASQIAAGVS